MPRINVGWTVSKQAILFFSRPNLNLKIVIAAAALSISPEKPVRVLVRLAASTRLNTGIAIYSILEMVTEVTRIDC